MYEPDQKTPPANLKPGWQTTEFWIAITAKILALATGAGVLGLQHGQEIQQQISAVVVGVFALIALTSTARAYIQSRTAVKSWWYKMLPVLLGLLFLQPAVHAQTAQTEPTCLFGRSGQQKADPAMMALLQQIISQQQQIIALLGQQHQAPQQQPQFIVLGQPYQPPLQQIPLGGLPLQQIPLGGPPRQDIPLGGPPRQDIPLGTPPRQEIPLAEPGKPAQPAPPQQIPLGPMPGTNPSGYQRYSWMPARAR